MKCTDEDLDITECRAEKDMEFENSCSHNNDVGLRCHEPKWAGVRFGVLAERANLQYLLIEKAGLLDYATNQLKPGTSYAVMALRVRLFYTNSVYVRYSTTNRF